MRDMKRRIGLASATFDRLSRMWKTSSISTRIKTKLYRTFITPILMCGSSADACGRKMKGRSYWQKRAD